MCMCLGVFGCVWVYVYVTLTVCVCVCVCVWCVWCVRAMRASVRARGYIHGAREMRVCVFVRALSRHDIGRIIMAAARR